jgi:hypothetical protein
MRRIIMVVLIVITSTVIYSQNSLIEPEGFTFIIGPRIGYGYSLMSKEEFTKQLNDSDVKGTYYPGNTVFGVNFEQRVLLGETNSHFAFQEIITINGLEQSLFLPVVAGLVAYRGGKGFEFGVGPLFSVVGIQVVGAIGWTITTNGVNIPIDFSYAFPNIKAKGSISLTTGFNFLINKKMNTKYVP